MTANPTRVLKFVHGDTVISVVNLHTEYAPYEIALIQRHDHVWQARDCTEQNIVQLAYLLDACINRIGAEATISLVAGNIGLNPADDPHPLSAEHPRIAAKTAHEFITFEGVDFFVRRLHWGNDVVEYQVYTEVDSYMDSGYSTVTSEGGRLWGDVTTYFDEKAWEHYPSWTDWRRQNVMAYQDFQQRVADQIASRAFPYDLRDTHTIRDGRRWRLDTDHLWLTRNG